MLRFVIALGLAGLAAAPAMAEITNTSEAGFVSKHVADVPAAPADVWKALIAPAGWWSSEHTYSGDAANLYIDAQATGCFCELLPLPEGAAEGTRRGSVEHMHVVYAEPGRVLRMTGGLGPLQSEAVHGTLTITLKALPSGGTRIQAFYVVGGYARFKWSDISVAVDKVLAEQVKRLAVKLGGAEAAEAAPADAPKP